MSEAWIYPEEERISAVVYTEEAKKYFDKISRETEGMSIFEYNKYIKDENSD
jgi:hypothetical protein